MLLKQALEINANNLEALMEIAALYEQLNETDMAIKYYEDIIKIHSKLPRVHYRLALAYLDKGLFDPAVQELRKELFVNPQNYDALCKLGELYIEAGEPSNALPLYQKAKDIMPEKFRAYLGLGMANWKLDKMEEAKENFQQVLSINPRHKKALFYMGSIYKDQKNYLGAENLFQSVYEQLRDQPSLSPEDKKLLVDSYIQYGEVELLLDRPRTAIDKFEQALSYDPTAAQAYFDMGRAAVKMNRYRVAEKHYKKATKIDPDEPRYYLGLGILYHNYLKELDKAIENYQQYLDLDGADKIKVAKWIKECGGEPVLPE